MTNTHIPIHKYPHPQSPLSTHFMPYHYSPCHHETADPAKDHPYLAGLGRLTGSYSTPLKSTSRLDTMYMRYTLTGKCATSEQQATLNLGSIITYQTYGDGMTRQRLPLKYGPSLANRQHINWKVSLSPDLSQPVTVRW